jgi:hypothetical protein
MSAVPDLTRKVYEITVDLIGERPADLSHLPPDKRLEAAVSDGYDVDMDTLVLYIAQHPELDIVSTVIRREGSSGFRLLTCEEEPTVPWDPDPKRRR